MAEVLSFELLYGLAAIVAAGMIWHRYPPADAGWAPGITMALFVSLALAVGNILLGEVWNWFLEGHRNRQ